MEILNRKDGIVTVQCDKTVYQIEEASFEKIKAQVTRGADAKDLLDLIAGANARTAKVYDAEKAKKKAEKATKLAAIERFNSELVNHIWSDSLLLLAEAYAIAKEVLAEAKDVPIVLNLADYKESENKQTLSGTYRFCDLTFGENNVPSIIIGLNASLPIVSARNDAKESRLAFQVAAHEEVMTFVSPTLNSEVKRDCFDVNVEKNVIYDAEIKAKGIRKGNGGGKKRPVMHIASGKTYETASAAGKEFYPDLKWSHRKVTTLAEKDDTFRFVTA